MPEHTKYPFFPENVQFWYETKRAFGASSYGASEFGEVSRRSRRLRHADSRHAFNSSDLDTRGIGTMKLRRA